MFTFYSENVSSVHNPVSGSLLKRTMVHCFTLSITLIASVQCFSDVRRSTYLIMSQKRI